MRDGGGYLRDVDEVDLPLVVEDVVLRQVAVHQAACVEHSPHVPVASTARRQSSRFNTAVPHEAHRVQATGLSHTDAAAGKRRGEPVGRLEKGDYESVEDQGHACLTTHLRQSQ